ncbi:MAG: hypothetical protein MI919_11950 [Holophagales bacterium]|nr:hypothetical protein [Holophagales bacterium]
MKSSRRPVSLMVLLLLTAFACASTASAQTYFLDLAAGNPAPNSPANPVVIPSIPEGIYDVTFVGTAQGALFDGWNAWGFVAGCDGNGANCTNGYFLAFACEVPGVGLVAIDPNGIWQTPELSIANAPVGRSFEVTAAGDLVCYLIDNNYADNLGGSSFRLDRRLAVTEIPTLSSWGAMAFVLLLAAGALVFVRRLHP